MISVGQLLFLIVAITVVDRTVADRSQLDFCFERYSVWMSRYAFSTSQAEVFDSFARLKAMNVTRVYFNVWASGTVYFNSPTAAVNQVSFGGDRLQWAVNAARQLDMEIYAWFEYGNMASFATLNVFASEAERKGWLLFNFRNNQRVYTTGLPGAGSFLFLDPAHEDVRNFLSNLVSDAARYDIDGVQLDDHFAAPNGFDRLDAIQAGCLQLTMEDFAWQVKKAIQLVNPAVKFSLSPSSLDFAINSHNVNWAHWYDVGLVDELVPQYYRTTAAAFNATIQVDFPRIPNPQESITPGIRLSGGEFPQVTPEEEVDQMLQISYDEGLREVTFWFSDPLLNGIYIPPPFEICSRRPGPPLEI